jgi:hypothetical protein
VFDVMADMSHVSADAACGVATRGTDGKKRSRQQKE